MRLRLVNEHRVVLGTEKQIVQAMRRTAVRAAGLTLEQYIDWCVENAAEGGICILIEGTTLDERCASLVREMIKHGMAEVLPW